MARRHQSLIRLSRDHYEGLLLAQQAREPERLIMSGWPGRNRGGFIAQFYREHLTPHFLAEEQSLFPLALSCIPDGKPLVDSLIKEHQELKRLAGDFERTAEDRDEMRLKQFGDLLEAHIRKEERQLFPLFEKHATPEILASAEQQILRLYPAA